MAELTAPFTKKTVDLSLIIFGATLIIVSGYSIWSTSYRRKMTTLPTGKILKCIGGCKYKSPDDYFWLDGQNELDVLDKSMVFTPNHSTASIVLKSGTKLTLYPNSLVQITNGSKGSSIDIIEGKINFEKISPSSFEKITVKGKEIPVPVPTPEAAMSSEEILTEISVEPELLEVKAPAMISLRTSPAVVNLEILNGTPPFKVYIEDNEEKSKFVTSSSSVAYKIKDPGIYNLKIEDSLGSSVKKLLTVEDLSVPEIESPKNGDILYTKSFRPNGKYNLEETELELKLNQAVVFRGLQSSIPRNLIPGFYTLSARRKNNTDYGDWSVPVNFQLVETKRPVLENFDESIYFNQVTLRWKRALAGVHLLIIKNEKNEEVIRIPSNEEQFVFTHKKMGKFSWTVTPMNENQLDEKNEWRGFHLIDTTQLLKEPFDKQRIISESLEEKVTFRWAEFYQRNLEVKLELKDEKNKKIFDVSGESYLELELKNVKNYKWKLILKKDSETIYTPEFTFNLDAPPPVRPISSEEIILKD